MENRKGSQNTQHIETRGGLTTTAEEHARFDDWKNITNFFPPIFHCNHTTLKFKKHCETLYFIVYFKIKVSIE